MALPAGLGMLKPGAPAVGGAHRYWRFNDFQVSSAALNLNEFAPHVGSTSIVTTKLTPSAFTSSSAPDVFGSTSSLNDGDMTTRPIWNASTATAGGFFIRADMGSAVAVSAVKLAGFDTTNRYPTGFALQYSDDDSSWTTQATVSSLAYPGNNRLSELIDCRGGSPATAHRYWRINSITIGGGGSFLEISEVQFYANDYVPVITSSNAPSSGQLQMLTDSVLPSASLVQWTDTVAEDAGFFIKFDFGAGFTAAITGLKMAADAVSGAYPTQVRAQYSDDNSSWTTLGTATGLTFPGNNTMSGLITF